MTLQGENPLLLLNYEFIKKIREAEGRDYPELQVGQSFLGALELDRDFPRKSFLVSLAIREFWVPKFPFLLNGSIPDVIQNVLSQQSDGYLAIILVIPAFHAPALPCHLISRQPSHSHFNCTQISSEGSPPSLDFQPRNVTGKVLEVTLLGRCPHGSLPEDLWETEKLLEKD